MLIALTVVFLLAVIFSVVLLFLIMPRVSDRADMDLLSTDYAHRGLWNESFPENSLPAFSLAVSEGYGIELDVRLSSDGYVMVFHDDSLKRLCGIDKRVNELTANELTSTRLCKTPYTIPTLRQVLELVDGKVPLLIEIKGEGNDEKLYRKLSEMLDTYAGAFALQSFNPLALAHFKRYRPRFARGQLVTKVKRVEGKRFPRLTGLLLSNMMLNFFSRPDFISISGNRVSSLSTYLCLSLFKCKALVWTVRKKEQYKKTRSRGMFAIFEGFKPNI